MRSHASNALLFLKNCRSFISWLMWIAWTRMKGVGSLASWLPAEAWARLKAYAAIAWKRMKGVGSLTSWLAGQAWVRLKTYAAVVPWPAVLASMWALLLAFAAIVGVRQLLGHVDSFLFIAIILTVSLFYLIYSGRLSELKAPGGIEAKFAHTAADAVEGISETIGYTDPHVIAKASRRDLYMQKLKEIDHSKPVLLTMTVGHHNYYTHREVKRYICVLAQLPNFRRVVFLDRHERFVAHMPASSLKQLLEEEKEEGVGSDFINTVNDGKIADLLRYPGVIEASVMRTSTNADALRQMVEQNADALVVVDEARRLCGVVEREQLLSQMIVALVR